MHDPSVSHQPDPRQAARCNLLFLQENSDAMIVMLWVALSYRNDKGNSERTWEMMIQKEIQHITSNLQEQQKDSRNIIIIL